MNMMTLYTLRTDDTRTLAQLIAEGEAVELSYMPQAEAAAARRLEMRMLLECAHGDLSAALDAEQGLVG